MEDELNLDLSWRIGETSFKKIVEVLTKKLPNNIIEFGSGASTVRLAMAFSKVNIFSIDHDSEFLRGTIALVEKYGLSDRVSVSFAPVKWKLSGLRIYKTYKT